MKRDRRAQLIDAQLHKGYTHVYDDLTSIWSREVVWYMGLIVLGILILSLTLPLYWRSYTQSTLATLYTGVLGIIVIFLYVWLVFSLGASASIDPLKEVSVLSVRIMTGVPRPYSKRTTGLSYRDIEHLRRIAEIEQNSADWRGSFVSFVIIGTLSVLIWILPFIWRTLNAPADPDAVQPAPGATQPISIDSLLVDIYLALSFLLLIILVVRFIWNMLTYFRLFLASEAANRVILKACEESLAFLEKHDLKERASFSLREKRAIAAHFGCKIVPIHDASWADKLWTWGFEPDGTIWYLVPPARDSQVQNLRLRLRHLRLSLRRYFGNGQS